VHLRAKKMMKQRKIAQNVGKDTHVRQTMGNRFKEQGSKTFQMLAGEVLITEPEPLFKQNMVTIGMARGGTVTSVAYPGAFIDPISGNLHGSYEGPIAGQMVMVGFENGNASSPFVVNRYPYQGKGNTLVENKYINPLTRKGFDATDVIMGHFSGSYLSFNTGILSGKIPGSVTLSAVTNNSIESSLVTSIMGGIYVELNGNTNFAVKYTELKTAFDLLRTEVNNLITAYNSHVHITTATIGASGTPGVISPTVSQAVPATADMSASQNLKVLM
jgi:hypothetical protein